MRKFLLPLVVVAGLGTTAAFAETASGAITAINPDMMTVTLADGMVYTFPNTEAFKLKLQDFKVGDLVTIDWAANGSAYDATSIAPSN